MKNKTIIIISGGTGGHIFPALAVAKVLQANGYRIVWLGSEIGMEKDLIGDSFKFYTMPAYQLRGKSLLAKLKMPWRLLNAVRHALCVFRKEKPCVAIVFGGFVSPPGGIAARLCCVPLFVQEQNSRAGLSNRFLARLSSKIFEAFPNTFPGLKHVVTVGNPIRQELINIAKPGERYCRRSGKIRLLVIGGSLGARAINKVVVDWLKTSLLAKDVEVLHQCGKKNFNDVKKQYDQNDLSGKLVPFIEDMVSALSWADLVLCRAGASTVSELAVVGLPAIYVPLPSAVDNHQYYNALYITDAGGGIMLEQKFLASSELDRCLKIFIDDRSALVSMAEKAYQKRLVSAADEIVNTIDSFCP